MSTCEVMKVIFLAGVCFGSETPILKNFRNKDEKFKYEEAPDIVRLRWMDEDEKEILVGFKNQGLMVYNTKLQMFTQHDTLDIGNGPLVDFSRHDK